MTKRILQFLPISGIVLFLLILPSACQRPDPRPNIIFMMTDDHGYQAISAYGSTINRTPNIDRLAAGGMRFERSFCTNSICGPNDLR